MKVQVIDHMGSDLSVVKAAKVSFANDEGVGEFLTDAAVEGTTLRSHEALIRYLARNGHWTPFAHTAITLRVSAPVPIRTQCFKHKVGFVENEESRRYISSTPEVFIPDVLRSAPTGGAKQGSDGAHPDSPILRVTYKNAVWVAIDAYEELIREGVCPEQARFVLPQAAIVNWYWTGSLAAYARFCGSRNEPHAQKEVRDLSVAVSDVIAPLFPYSWAALTENLT